MLHNGGDRETGPFVQKDDFGQKDGGIIRIRVLGIDSAKDYW